ncbi:MAG: septum formation initiator family protein [Verrucomicrobia bacterium]|nr:septum formation initiator family protein [Verrucomicrobiota bacterium]
MSRLIAVIVAALCFACVVPGFAGSDKSPSDTKLILADPAAIKQQQQKWREIQRDNKRLEKEIATLKERNRELLEKKRGLEREVADLEKTRDFLAKRSVKVWTSKKGSRIKALLVGDNGDMVELKEADGNILKFDRSLLCDEDITYLDRVRGVWAGDDDTNRYEDLASPQDAVEAALRGAL